MTKAVTKEWYTTKYASKTGVIEVLECEREGNREYIYHRNSRGLLSLYRVGKDAFEREEEAIERVKLLLKRSVKNAEKRLAKLRGLVPVVVRKEEEK